MSQLTTKQLEATVGGVIALIAVVTGIAYASKKMSPKTSDSGSVTGFGNPLGSLGGPLPGPNGPLPGPNGPLPGPNGPLPGPLPGPNGPLPGPNGPLPGPLPGPNGPLPGPNGPTGDNKGSGTLTDPYIVVSSTIDNVTGEITGELFVTPEMGGDKYIKVDGYPTPLILNIPTTLKSNDIFRFNIKIPVSTNVKGTKRMVDGVEKGFFQVPVGIPASTVLTVDIDGEQYPYQVEGHETGEISIQLKQKNIQGKTVTNEDGSVYGETTMPLGGKQGDIVKVAMENGDIIEITLPNETEGSVIHFDLPSVAPLKQTNGVRRQNTTTNEEYYEVTIPDGSQPGEMLMIDCDDGQKLKERIPFGVTGNTFEIPITAIPPLPLEPTDVNPSSQLTHESVFEGISGGKKTKLKRMNKKTRKNKLMNTLKKLLKEI